MGFVANIFKTFAILRGKTQDKGGVLVGGQGSLVWLAGVIEEICEDLDQV